MNTVRHRARAWTTRSMSVTLAGMVIAVGLAVNGAQPAAAYLGESETTMSFSPGASVVYGTVVTANVLVRDVSSSCEAVVFASCDDPTGYITLYIDGANWGGRHLDAPQYSQYDDRSWMSWELPILDTGTHQIEMRYSGTFDDSSASATLTILRADCTLQLTQDKAQTTQGDPVLFSVQTPFEPGKEVTFFDDNSRELAVVQIAWDGFIHWGAFWQPTTLPVGTTRIHAFYWSINYYPCISNDVDHTVVPVNTPPQANDDSTYTYAGQPVTVDVLKNDVNTENDPLTVTVSSPPANGQAVVNADNTITYAPNAGYNGPLDTFDYRIAEPSGQSDTGTVSVLVVCLVKRADSYSVPYNTPLVVAAPGVLANDDHGCDPSRGVSLGDPPQHGTVSLDPTGGFTYTPAAGYSGGDSFTYVFTNTLIQGPAATVTLTVATRPPDRPPVATDSSVTALEGGGTPVTLAGTDPDGDPLTFSVVAGPAHGALTGTAPTLTYTPAAGYVGPDSFDFKVDDGYGGTDTGTVTVTVTAATPVATKVTAAGGTRVVYPREVAFEGLTARVVRSDTGAPIPGQNVTFTVDGTVVCTAVTTATGDATCSSGRYPTSAFTPGATFTASYAGDGHNLLGASGSATVPSRAGKA